MCPGLSCHKHDFLVNELIHEHYTTHHAEADIISLQKLVSNTKPSDDIDQKIITKAMSFKTAIGGLKLEHLKLAFDRNFLSEVLYEKIS